MNMKDNTFDTVIDTFGLEYYTNPEKALNGKDFIYFMKILK